MKILKIFGLVVGIHVVLFMFVFAIPGCRSTSRHSPPPPASIQAERSPGAAAMAPSPAMESSSPSPVNASASAPLESPISASSSTYTSSAPSAAPAMVSFPGANGSSQRFNPVRPGSPEANALKSGATAPTTTPASSYTVVDGDTLWKIAKKNSVSIKELAAANNLKENAALRPGHKLIIPGKASPTAAPTSATVPAAGEMTTMTYKVKAGDTLAVIAKRAGTTVAAIKKLNNLKSDIVQPGKELTLPAGGSTAAAVANAPAPMPSAETESAARPSSGDVRHTVRPGETLGVIAKKYGVTKTDIAVANNITDPTKLGQGKVLIIPHPKVTPPPADAARNNRSSSSQPESTPASSESTAPASNPISPISAPTESNPITPATSPITPPTISVQEGASPISAPK